jgi:hypothetical protein
MTGQEVKRKLAAILSTDVKGYGRLIREDKIGTEPSASSIFVKKFYHRI